MSRSRARNRKRSSSSPLAIRTAASRAAALSELLAATGAVAFYDSAYGVTASGGVVTDWAPRIGSETVSAAGAARPTYGSIFKGGKSGVTFDGSNNYMGKTSSALAAVLDGAQGYSSLIVAKTAGGTTKAVWGCGNASINEYIREGVTAGADWRQRRTVAGGSITSTGTGAVGTTSPFLITNVYTGSAYSGWVGGAQTLNASTNSRAPVCDIFSIGAAYEAGSPLAGYRFYGTIWGVLISTTQWSAAQRQALESAANRYWGLGLSL